METSENNEILDEESVTKIRNKKSNLLFFAVIVFTSIVVTISLIYFFKNSPANI